jgi:hypothetical protein
MKAVFRAGKVLCLGFIDDTFTNVHAMYNIQFHTQVFQIYYNPPISLKPPPYPRPSLPLGRRGAKAEMILIDFKFLTSFELHFISAQPNSRTNQHLRLPSDRKSKTCPSHGIMYGRVGGRPDLTVLLWTAMVAFRVVIKYVTQNDKNKAIRVVPISHQYGNVPLLDNS